jgi:hypothetical protein
LSGSGSGELARDSAGSLVAAPEAHGGGSEASRELDLFQALGAMLEQRDALAGVRLALHMCICMYVCIHIHTHTHTHANTHTHIHTHTYTHTHTHTHTHTYIYSAFPKT